MSHSDGYLVSFNQTTAFVHHQLLGFRRVLFFFQAEDGIRDWSVTGVQTCVFFFSSRRRHTRLVSDWSSDVCSSDLVWLGAVGCARTLAVYAVPVASRAAKVNAPSAATLRFPPPLSRSTSPEPVRPLTVPPTVKVGTPTFSAPPKPHPERQAVAISRAAPHRVLMALPVGSSSPRILFQIGTVHADPTSHRPS